MGGVLDTVKYKAGVHQVACRLIESKHASDCVSINTDIKLAVTEFKSDGPDLLLCLADFEALCTNQHVTIPKVSDYMTQQHNTQTDTADLHSTDDINTVHAEQSTGHELNAQNVDCISLATETVDNSDRKDQGVIMDFVNQSTVTEVDSVLTQVDYSGQGGEIVQGALNTNMDVSSHNKRQDFSQGFCPQQIEMENDFNPESFNLINSDTVMENGNKVEFNRFLEQAIGCKICVPCAKTEGETNDDFVDLYGRMEHIEQMQHRKCIAFAGIARSTIFALMVLSIVFILPSSESAVFKLFDKLLVYLKGHMDYCGIATMTMKFWDHIYELNTGLWNNEMLGLRIFHLGFSLHVIQFLQKCVWHVWDRGRQE